MIKYQIIGNHAVIRWYTKNLHPAVVVQRVSFVKQCRPHKFLYLIYCMDVLTTYKDTTAKM